jgi:membrane DNA delivery protein
VKAGSFIDVLSGIVFVALIATLVSHANTAGDINAAGNAFSNSLKAATAG